MLDPQLKFTEKNSNQISRMVQAASACVNSEESRRPNVDEIIAILRGKDPSCLSRNKAILPGNSIDSCPQLHRSRSEMKSHFALAMLGVEFEDDDHIHCR